LNESNKNIPLVLLHGLGAGSALWVQNYDALCKERPVYAIDLLGFARSSRPNFDKDPEVAEMQFVRSIEEWRKEVNLPKMILLGHSFGSYLACSYALTYPNRVHHLVLVDSWGTPQKPKDVEKKYNVPMWIKGVAYLVQPFNPLWLVRASGPFGKALIEKTRPDIIKKYNAVVKDEDAIANYIHQCNSQSPTGESAFHSLMEGFGWAKNPMINRIHQMQTNVPISLIFGSRSWVDSTSGEVIKRHRPNSYVNSYIIEKAGHHVFADKPEEFNKIVTEICKLPENEILMKAEDEKSPNEE
jgi:abhydrolase domain-containing protein 5